LEQIPNGIEETSEKIRDRRNDAVDGSQRGRENALTYANECSEDAPDGLDDALNERSE